jgi:hypothetical protein
MSNAYAQVAPFESVSFKGRRDIDITLPTARDLMNEGIPFSLMFLKHQ